MAISNASDTVAFRAAAALTQYQTVYQSSGAYVSADVLGTTPGVGFVQNAATTAGDIVEVAFETGCETLAIAGQNNITVNMPLMSSTGSKVIAATSSGMVCAIAREASSAVGDLIRVEIANYQLN